MTESNHFLSSEEELDDFLTAWEAGTLPKAEFTHAAHVAVAVCYTWTRTPAEALPWLRERISAFNVAVGGQNTAGAGYHETLTHFWAEVVGSFTAGRRHLRRVEVARAAIERFGPHRDLPKSYYTHDILADQVARRQWVPPQKLREFAEFCLDVTRNGAPAHASPDTRREK